MPESETPPTPRRRVGVYDRLGRASERPERTSGSPAMTIGIAVVLLITVIAIIMALTS
jgi:hypothetical protein